MVVSGHDPFQHFSNQVIKNVFSPIESNFRNVAKNFEHCFHDAFRDAEVELASAQLNLKKKGQPVVENNDVLGKGKVPNKDIFGIVAAKRGINVHKSFDGSTAKNGSKDLPLECLIGFMLDQLSNFPKFNVFVQDHESKHTDYEALAGPIIQFEGFKSFFSILGAKKLEADGFLGNLNFARIGGGSSSIVSNAVNEEDIRGDSPQKSAYRLLSIPLSNVERLRATLATLSLTELTELLPQIRKTSNDEHPDKKKLFSVQDFFRYTEAEGKQLFEELDRDGDGKVTLADLEVAMRKRRLPKKYARELMGRTTSHLFAKSFGWDEFLSMMEQKEPRILRAYTRLCLSNSGTLQKNEILTSFEGAGLPANEDSAATMMQFLNADTEESVSYSHFRNFMVLVPLERLKEDPRRILFEALNKGADPTRAETRANSVLKSALAGGFSCAFSAALMHPVDTVKTQVQASTSLSFMEILSKLPQIGLRGLYKGSIPAILGQFASHGLRTGICESTKFVLINVAPKLPEIQVESVGSFCGTFLGTVMRIPCEVLKQRLQAGLYENVGEAILRTWQQDGVGAFFRGTGMTLCRELPFYVAGSSLYAQSKKAAERVLRRELKPWETVVVGAISGGLTAVSTTPFDVIKTRMMISTQGQPITVSVVSLAILRHEGPLGFFKGAVPRFFWVAPLGAINFGVYELLRKAMITNEKAKK